MLKIHERNLRIMLLCPHFFYFFTLESILLVSYNWLELPAMLGDAFSSMLLGIRFVRRFPDGCQE